MCLPVVSSVKLVEDESGCLSSRRTDLLVLAQQQQMVRPITSGKTTTFYAILNALNSHEMNLTIEALNSHEKNLTMENPVNIT